MTVTIMVGDVREKLRTLADDSIHCCVTSPPYWGLRDYGVEGQIGLEESPAEFIATLVEVFEEVRRVLRPDGTCWINMGDSYAGSWGAQSRVHAGKHAPNVSAISANQVKAAQIRAAGTGSLSRTPGLKAKDLCMMPHRLAIALQDAGWWVRQDIVWHKPNPMPESVCDRCTKAHEYIFLLTKSERYYYDGDAIAEPSVADHGPGNKTHKALSAYESGDEKHRTKQGLVAYAERQRGKAGGNAFRGQGSNRDSESGHANREGRDLKEVGTGPTRNKRSVWTMATKPFSEAHFATFPPELPKTCISAGCPEGGIVLDPFFGAGTTGVVAQRLQRDCIGIELNPNYAEIARKRIYADFPLMADVKVVNTLAPIEDIQSAA